MEHSWAEWQAHVAQVVADTGDCVILCNDEGEPIMELPPIIKGAAQDESMAFGDMSITIPTLTPHGELHPVVDVLVDEGMTSDSRGVLKPDTDGTFLVVVCREGVREVLLSIDRDVDGITQPTELTINGTGMLSYLGAWPCPSVPSTWLPRMQMWTRDEAQVYYEPRYYAPIEMAEKADGYTVTGPADVTVMKLIQDSLDAGNLIQGWDSDPHLVVDWQTTGRTSPVVNIRTADLSLWETIEMPARNAGLEIHVDMWWPGDEPVLVRGPGGEKALTSWQVPMGVVRVLQIG